jgi:uncharacterized protein YpbB
MQGQASMKISTILDKFDENQLFLPAFQRESFWKRDDAKQLIDCKRCVYRHSWRSWRSS